MSHSTRPRVLIVAPSIVATFTEQDARLLSPEFDVVLRPHTGIRGMASLRRAIKDSDLTLAWFAGRHALPAALICRSLKRPLVTIVGGYEAAWIPEIGYGIRPRSIQARVIRWILKHSIRILTVSRFSDAESKSRWPELTVRTRLIHNGVDTGVFRPSNVDERREVLCVGMIRSETIDKKGWRLYWETARAMPDVQFHAVGRAVDAAAAELLEQTPPNLKWHGPLYGSDLVAAYGRASVYFQGSLHESFGVSVAEAMACGCIPVLSRAGALPELAGEHGFYLETRSVESAVSMIRAALAAPPDRRTKVRERILSGFSSERRGDLLRQEIHDVLAGRTRPSV